MPNSITEWYATVHVGLLLTHSLSKEIYSCAIKVCNRHCKKVKASTMTKHLASGLQARKVLESEPGWYIFHKKVDEYIKQWAIICHKIWMSTWTTHKNRWPSLADISIPTQHKPCNPCLTLESIKVLISPAWIKILCNLLNSFSVNFNPKLLEVPLSDYWTLDH